MGRCVGVCQQMDVIVDRAPGSDQEPILACSFAQEIEIGRAVGISVED